MILQLAIMFSHSMTNKSYSQNKHRYIFSHPLKTRGAIRRYKYLRSRAESDSSLGSNAFGSRIGLSR